MILMLFHLFCMFDDFWRINQRSQNSAGKGPSRHHISKDQQLTKNIPKLLFCQMTEAAKTGGQGWPPQALTRSWRGPTSWRATTWCGPVEPHLGLPSWLPSSSGEIAASGCFSSIVDLRKYGVLTVLF